MRLLLVAAMLCFAGCSKTALRSTHDGQAPDSPTDAAQPTGDTRASDGQGPADAFPVDLNSAPDVIRPDEATAGCTSLPVTWLDEPSAIVCPPSAATSACAANDVGAVVARSSECLSSWGLIPFQCIMWPSLDDAQEFVVLKVEDCNGTIQVMSLLACADHIQIEYYELGTCSSCNGQRSYLRVLVLPRDARPVIAVSLGGIFPPCLPPGMP